MTPRERVMEVLKMPWRPDPDPYAPGRREFLLQEELEGRLEQAIIAAVEEDREARRKPTKEIRLPYDRVREALEIAENGPGTCAAIPVLYANGETGDIIIERPRKGDKTITAAAEEERLACQEIAQMYVNLIREVGFPEKGAAELIRNAIMKRARPEKKSDD
jgi:hypothetical protein